MSDKKEKAVKILKQFTALKNERSGWAANVTTAMNLVLPQRSKMDVTTGTKSYNISDDRQDATATTSLQLMANGLLGNVASQNAVWFDLALDKLKAEDDYNVKVWMDEVKNTFYKLFSKSSFYQGAWQVYQDGGGSGLGVMYVGENLEKESIDFVPYSPAGVYIEINDRGVVDTLFYETTMSARSIIERYGEKELKKNFLESAKKNPYTRFVVIKACFSRKDRDIQKIDGPNKPFASIHILKNDSVILRDSGFDSFPYAIWRYEHASETVYPWSPTLTGYPDIRRLNAVSKSTTRLAQLIGEPPMAIPAEMYDDFELKPRFKVKAYNMNRLPVALNMGQGYPVDIDREKHYQDIVKEHYFTNFFLSMSAAVGQKLTATQVIEMQGEKATVIGGMVSRLTQEFFDPLFDRMFMIAARNRWIPDPPESLLAQGGEISIDYLGILPMAQKRMLELTGPVNALQNFLPVAQAFPEMMNMIKPYELGKTLLIGGGMPHSIMRDKDEYEQITQQQKQQAQEALQAEQQNKEADSLNKGAKAPEKGSPSELVLEGMKNGGQ